MKKKVYSPNINLYDDFISYLEDFFSINKSQNSKFSYRYLALKLNWSAPYLNDVIKGRKKLSLGKAVELINYIGLKGAKAERFLFLYLSNVNPEFSHSSVHKDAILARNAEREHSRAMSLDEFEKLSTLLDYYILYFLELNKGVWNIDDFINKLTIQSKPSKEIVQFTFNRLEKNNYVILDPKTSLYKLNVTDQLIFDQDQDCKTELETRRLESLLQQEKEYAKNYFNYLKMPIKDKRAFCSGIINLDMELFTEAQDRIFALRNYLYELDAKGQQRYAEAKGPESRVWQFSINIFSLFENQETES